MMSIRKQILLFGLSALCWIGLPGRFRLLAQEPFTGEKTDWHGYDRYDFLLDEGSGTITPFKSPEGEKSGVRDPAKGSRRCIVIVPKKAAPGNPWSWRGCYWDYAPQTEIELLRRGFHVAYISASATIKPD